MESVSPKNSYVGDLSIVPQQETRYQPFSERYTNQQLARVYNGGAMDNQSLLNGTAAVHDVHTQRQLVVRGMW